MFSKGEQNKASPAAAEAAARARKGAPGLAAPPTKIWQFTAPVAEATRWSLHAAWGRPAEEHLVGPGDFFQIVVRTSGMGAIRAAPFRGLHP